MLQTPLYGYFFGENNRLAFLPPKAYLGLVGAVWIAGFVALLNSFTGIFAFQYPAWWQFLGVMLIGAGILAVLSLQSVWFDLKEGRYIRRQGGSLLTRGISGRITDLDAVVLLAEQRGQAVTYHLVLHWKQASQPPLLMESDTRQIRYGQPLNFGAAPLLDRGARYARALRVNFFDNSHFASPSPVPFLNR